MKVVILAGGFGSRMSEETQVRPKPLVEIGGKPILWHIMKIYAAHGMSDFIIACGYKGFMIKQYFANYFVNEADCRFDLKNNRMEVLRNGVESWTVTLIDTGESTMTGGRLKREREPLESLAHDGKLAAYKHRGFWQPMDSLRDKIYLEELWASGQAPWKIW